MLSIRDHGNAEFKFVLSMEKLMTTPNSNPHTVENESYDAHIVPAETAARKEREGENYKHTPENTEESDSIDTTGGYTVDGEGLINNYAIEPEMYYETPDNKS
jgi:hypothetical protein